MKTTNDDTHTNRQKTDEEYAEITRELFDFACKLSAEERHVCATLLKRLRENIIESKIEEVAYVNWLSRRTSAYKLERDMYYDFIFVKALPLLKDSSVKDTMYPHLATLRRFLHEQDAPKYTMDQARIDTVKELADSLKPLP